MTQEGQWQVAGSASEIYKTELVPAVFGVWAPILIELAQPAWASALSISRAVPVLWRGLPLRLLVRLAAWLELISILECLALPDQYRRRDHSSGKKLVLTSFHSPTVTSTSYVANWACNSSLIGRSPARNA
jgi:hypothetical protein